MATARLKYPCRVGGIPGKPGGILYGKGTEVEVMAPDHPDVQAIWPGVKTNPSLDRVAVKLPGQTRPTIHKLSHLEVG